MKYYIIAGEKSGDVHGGNLLASLKERDPNAQFRGIGGDTMRKQGMHLIVHHRAIDFAGFVGLIGHLRTIYRQLKQCKKDIVHYTPHVVVLIDYGGFNMRIARFCKKKDIRVFYYILPKVWAWGRSRARTLKACVDRAFCILPFEKAFYQKFFDWEVDYVGNPVLDAIKQFRPTSNFLQDNVSADDKRPVIALLPGSRKSELKYITPILVRIILSRPEYRFVVAAVRLLPSSLYAPFTTCPNATIVLDAPYDVLSNARAAIVASGTATLETALLGVPQVVIYKAAALEYFLASMLLRVKYVSLVNLIANRLVVKEYLQQSATLKVLHDELKQLVDNVEYRTAQREGYEQIRSILDVGSASYNTAALMVKYLQA